jgi:hypothetical protein
MTAALCLYLAIGRRSVHLLQKQSSAILSMTDFDPLELQRVLESEMSRHSDEEMYQTYLELDSVIGSVKIHKGYKPRWLWRGKPRAYIHVVRDDEKLWLGSAIVLTVWLEKHHLFNVWIPRQHFPKLKQGLYDYYYVHGKREMYAEEVKLLLQREMDEDLGAEIRAALEGGYGTRVPGVFWLEFGIQGKPIESSFSPRQTISDSLQAPSYWSSNTQKSTRHTASLTDGTGTETIPVTVEGEQSDAPSSRLPNLTNLDCTDLAR